MGIYFYDNKILFVDGQIAMHERCCCCLYEVQVLVDWSGLADLDLYGSVDGEVVYFGNTYSSGLSYVVDAHPVCDEYPEPPEEIGGEFSSSKTFWFWYDQYSDCEVETAPSLKRIRITNTGGRAICVNGQNVEPGQYWETSEMAYAGYNTGSSPNFSGGTEIEVTCGSCD